MSFSWKELVCHGLLKEIGEPSLVKELLKMVMKERWLFLEEEAREFQSEFVCPVLGVYFHWQPWDPIIIQEFKKRVGYCKVARPAAALSPEMWLTAIRYKNVKKEFISSWKERIPEQRRRAVMSNKETYFRAKHNARTSIIWTMAELRHRHPSITESINWYGEIHEGRYYLFWDKKIAPAIKDASERRRQSESFMMSGFDINIIDGEGLYRHISDTWVYAFNHWTNSPGGWGARQSEFTMVHSIGKKEKMHIDDMFLKE